MAVWKVEKRHSACIACNRVFEDGDRMVSTLVVSEEGVARADRCPPCSDTLAEDPEVIFWSTRFVLDPKKTLQLDYAGLEALFLQMEGIEATRLRELRYVLCLLLMRKRRLKVDRIVRSKAGEAFLVRRPRRKESLTVWLFDFKPEEMVEVAGRLNGLFDGGDPAEALAQGPELEPLAEVPDTEEEQEPDSASDEVELEAESAS